MYATIGKFLMLRNSAGRMSVFIHFYLGIFHNTRVAAVNGANKCFIFPEDCFPRCEFIQGERNCSQNIGIIRGTTRATKMCAPLNRRISQSSKVYWK